jgi:branched-chain amino acid transport system substrate-binding protein
LAAVGAATAVALALVACGSSSGGKTPGASAASGAPPSAGALALSQPLKLGFLWEIKGESSVAIDDANNGAELAVDEINSSGGVGGHKIETFRVPSSPLDAQQNVSSFLEAVQKKPSVMIGLLAPTQETELVTQISRAKIPVLVTTTGDDFTRFGTPGGDDYSWFLGPYNPGLVKGGMNYLINTLHKNKIGLMGTTGAFGEEGVQAAQEALRTASLKPFATAMYSPIATDLTAQVLKMRGADAVLNWGYPNPTAIQMKQFVQNGIDIPTFAGVSIYVSASSGLLKGKALSNGYVLAPADPLSPSYSPALEAFVKKYKARYGTAPTQPALWAYDGVNVAVAAVKKAGSASPDAVNRVLGSLDYKSSVGAPELRADPAHFMAHQLVISNFDANGVDRILQRSVIPDVQKAG